MPAVAIGYAIAAWGEYSEVFVEMLEFKGVYDRNEFGSERSGVAAALCYIHGGKDISPDVCERETAVRNACALDRPATPRHSCCIFAIIQRAAMDKIYCF